MSSDRVSELPRGEPYMARRKQYEEEEETHRQGFCSKIREFLQISVIYSLADVRKRPRNTIIGIIAVFCLVFFSGAVLVAIFKAPYVLLRLAELSTGETDIILQGGGNVSLLNFTALNALIMRSPDVLGATPRWILRAEVRSQRLVAEAERRAGAGSVDSSASIRYSSSNVLVVDTARERSVGVGRAWPYRQIGYGESQLYYSAAEYIGVRPNIGERISLSLDLNSALGLLDSSSSALSYNISRPTDVTDPLSWFLLAFFTLNNITEDSVNVLNVSRAQAPFTLADAIDGTYGKYSAVLGNVVMLDYKQLAEQLVEESCVMGPQVIKPADGFYFPTYQDLLGIPTADLQDVDLAEYSMMVVANFKKRYGMYYAETEQRNRRMTELSNSLMVAAGLDFQGTVQFPLITALEAFDTFKVLLVSTFVTVVVCIVVLGGILMFALLRMNAEERQFELAMLRAQGMPRLHITGVLTGQTLLFTLPGVTIGICLILALNAIVERALSSFTKAPANTANMPVVAAVISVLLGLLLPAVASYGPVKRALGGSLRDALDVYRQVQNEVSVQMIKLEEMGLATWQILLGIFLVVIGFVIYYLMPLSFIFENMMLFFILLDLILLCMITGLCMMLFVVEPYVERLVLWCMLWFKEKRLGTLIRKNLRSHSERNSKAYMMFLLTVGCLTAAGVMFDILANVSSQLFELTAGAQITVTSASIGFPLDREELDRFLETEAAQHVQGWAYSSFPLGSYPQIRTNTVLSNFVTSWRPINVAALSRNFQNAVYSDYMMVDKYNSRYSYARAAGNKRDVVGSLYTDPASSRAASNGRVIATGLPNDTPPPNISATQEFPVAFIVSAAAQDELGLSIDGAAGLSYNYTASINGSGPVSTRTQFYLEPRAFMNRVSGYFAISSLPLLFRSGSVLVSEDSFRQMLNPTNLNFGEADNVTIAENAYTDVRYQTLYIRLKDKLPRRQRNTLVNALQPRTDTLYHTTVDTQATIDEIRTIQNLIMYFFYFTGVICIILCTFMMWLTFISNVQQNAWSLGVLRSLGFRNAQLMRSAVYEALSIVIAAFVLGFLVGVVVGATLALQLTGFMVLPYRFVLPYPLILIVLGLALLAAVVGSLLPFYSLRKKAIAHVLRGI